MKAFVIAGFAVLAAGAAYAQPGGAMAVAQGKNTQTYNVPPGSKDQTVIITTRDIKPGDSVAPHIHHGVEMAEVTAGTFEVFVKGQQPYVVHTGESFIIPREAPHAGRPVAGSGTVHLAVTLVIDKGTAPRTPVSDVLIPK